MGWIRRAMMALGAGLVLAGCQTTQPDTGGGAGMFPDPAGYRPVNMPPGVTMTPEQIRMDQLVKLQTELMIVSLTCDQQYRNPTLYNSYAQWTMVNQAELNRVQDEMGRFLGAHFPGSNARVFDTYRTKMANDESAVVNRMGIAAYCRARKDQYMTATAYTPAQLRTYVDQLATMYAPRYTPEARRPDSPLVAVVAPDGSAPVATTVVAEAPAAPAAAAPVAAAAVPAAPVPGRPPSVEGTAPQGGLVAEAPAVTTAAADGVPVLALPPRVAVPTVPLPVRRPAV